VADWSWGISKLMTHLDIEVEDLEVAGRPRDRQDRGHDLVWTV
jgi:hypothetical protein